MDKQFLKKITCQSPEDIPYISALVSEGKIKSGELTIKDMRSGDQRQMKVSELINFLSSDENL